MHGTFPLSNALCAKKKIMSFSNDPRTQKLVAFYQGLDLHSLSMLGQLYTDDIVFKDPFNEVSNLAGLQHIFNHMFAALRSPKFVVSRSITEQDHAFLVWNFSFERKGLRTPMVIHGSSYVQFTQDGRVCFHRDYWDSNEELFCKLPLIGLPARWLRRQLKS